MRYIFTVISFRKCFISLRPLFLVQYREAIKVALILLAIEERLK